MAGTAGCCSASAVSLAVGCIEAMAEPMALATASTSRAVPVASGCTANAFFCSSNATTASVGGVAVALNSSTAVRTAFARPLPLEAAKLSVSSCSRAISSGHSQGFVLPNASATMACPSNETPASFAESFIEKPCPETATV